MGWRKRPLESRRLESAPYRHVQLKTVEIRRLRRALMWVDTRSMAAIMALLLVGIVPVSAQDGEFEQVDNPFQDGFSYRVGDDLTPNVELDGVRWRTVRVAPKGDREIEPDRSVPITVDLAFESRRDDSVELLIILLLEDGLGNGLERLRCDPPFKLAPGSLKELQFKFKVEGRNLLGTRSLYLFCELQE
jgi:hypothetical protein